MRGFLVFWGSSEEREGDRVAGVGSPFPSNPRGARKKRVVGELMIVVPKVDPQWEFAALTALMKPPRKANLVAHRHPNQGWSEELAERVEGAARAVGERLGLPVEVTRVPGEAAGDLLMVIRMASRDRGHFFGLGAAVSRAAPGVWFKLDRLWICEGKWMRRVFGTKLQLGPAADVHVPRGVREQLKGLL